MCNWKQKICDFHACSDAEDRQYPNCGIYGRPDCGLKKYEEMREIERESSEQRCWNCQHVLTEEEAEKGLTCDQCHKELSGNGP